MTKIITRVLKDAAQAERALRQMEFRGFPKRNRHVIHAGDNAASAMARAGVHDSAIGPYSAALDKGHVVMAVKATYKPLGAAKLTREIMERVETVDMGAKVVEEYAIAWEPDTAPSVLKDHPLLLTLPGMEMPGRISDAFGMPMLKNRRHKRNLMDGNKRMSRMFWPMPLLSTKSRRRKVISGGRQMSKAFWPGKLLSTKPRRKKVIPGGGPLFSRRLGMKTIS